MAYDGQTGRNGENKEHVDKRINLFKSNKIVPQNQPDVLLISDGIPSSEIKFLIGTEIKNSKIKIIN